MINSIALTWPDAWPPAWPDAWPDWPVRPEWPGGSDWADWLTQSGIVLPQPDRIDELSFAAPQLLWGLLLVPLALLAYLVAQRRRGRYAIRFTNLDLLAGLIERKPGPRRHLPPLLYLGAVALIILALARPEAPVTVAREEATIVLVLDVSGSMEAQDVAPSRLAAAQAAANTFLDQVPERFRVGVVTFSDTAQAIVQPTTDHDVVRSSVAGLRAYGGTAMGDAIVRALASVPNGSDAEEPAPAPPVSSNVGPTAAAQPILTPEPDEVAAREEADQAPSVVVMLSDGTNTMGAASPEEAAREAGRRGVPVFTISLGTPDGVILQRDADGDIRRNPVPPDEETLAQIAELSGGRSYSAPTEEDLRTIYEALGSRLGRVEERREVTAVFTGGGLALLILGGGLAVVWFNRFP